MVLGALWGPSKGGRPPKLCSQEPDIWAPVQALSPTLWAGHSPCWLGPAPLGRKGQRALPCPPARLMGLSGC